MGPTILIKFCGYYRTFETQQYGTIGFSRESPWNWKNIFFPSPNVGPKPADQSSSNSIYRALLQISLACIIVFDLPLKLIVVHIRKKLKFLFYQKRLQIIFVDL